MLPLQLGDWDVGAGLLWFDSSCGSAFNSSTAAAPPAGKELRWINTFVLLKAHGFENLPASVMNVVAMHAGLNEGPTVLLSHVLQPPRRRAAARPPLHPRRPAQHCACGLRRLHR